VSYSIVDRDPDAVGPGLGAEDADPQAEVARLSALLRQRLGQVQREGWRRRDHVRLEVLQRR
jgi:hypothetical protein